MAWGGMQLTRRGQDLNAKVLLGQTELIIAKVAAGDGIASGSVINLTDLVHETLPMPIISGKRLPDGTALWSTLFSNKGLGTGFFFREMGVWATDPDLGDILYGYDFFGPDPQWIPPGNSSELIGIKYNLGMKISSTIDVVITLDEDLQFMTREELEAMIGETIAPVVDGKIPIIYLPELTANIILESNGQSVEANQRRQDEEIEALQEGIIDANTAISGLQGDRVRSMTVTLTTSGWTEITEAAYPIPYARGARYMRQFTFSGIASTYGVIVMSAPTNAAQQQYAKDTGIVAVNSIAGAMQVFVKRIPAGSFPVQFIAIKQTLD